MNRVARNRGAMLHLAKGRPIRYVGSMAGASALSFGENLTFAALLDTRGFGQYTLALLILQVATYVGTAGLAEGLGREVPMLFGAGRVEDADRARAAAIRAGVVTAGVVGLSCTIAIAILSRSNADYAPLVWVGAMCMATVICNLLLIDLAGRARSVEYASMLLMKNGGGLLIGAAAIPLLGVSGAFIGETVAAVITAGAIATRYSRGILTGSHHDARREALRIARIGVPFMLSSIVLSQTVNLDRWFVESHFGVATLGQYAFAFLIWSGGSVLGTMLSVYLNPRIVSRCARTGDVGAMFADVRRIGLSIGAVFAVGAVPVLWLLGQLIDVWYPQYLVAKPLLPLAYLSTMLWAVNYYGAVFVVRGQGFIPLWISSANAVVCIVAFAIAARAGASLFAYAAIFCAGRALYLVSCIITAKLVFRNWSLDTSSYLQPDLQRAEL